MDDQGFKSWLKERTPTLRRFAKALWAWIWLGLIWIDQGLNWFLSPLLNRVLDVMPEHRFGNPDETLSSVFGKNLSNCKACYLICMVLHLLDRGHCKKSIEADE